MGADFSSNINIPHKKSTKIKIFLLILLLIYDTLYIT